MKLVVAALYDFKAVSALAMELVEQGCLADHVTFLTDHTLAPDNTFLLKPSLARLLQTKDLSIWAIREAEYFNRGVRDRRVLQHDTTARMASFNRYQTSSRQLSTDRCILRHQPLVLLHVTSRSTEALSYVKCLMKYAQDQVQMIDTPNW